MGLYTFIFGDGSAANGKTPEQLDQELKELQARRAAQNPEKFNTREYNRAFNEHMAIQEAQDADIEGQIEESFDEGLDEGAANISRAVAVPFKVAGKALKGVMFGIPVWVWLLAGAGAFFYFGGGPILKAFIKKKSKT